VEVMSCWFGVPENYRDYEGFTYLITNLLNGKKYVGKKSFWNYRTLKPLKGKRQKRHVKKESNWRDYWGSSKQLLADIEKYGEENFKREILSLHRNKWDLAYYEAKYQFDNEVLFRDDWYNGIINIRLGRRK
jgi:hypothetical protein